MCTSKRWAVLSVVAALCFQFGCVSQLERRVATLERRQRAYDQQGVYWEANIQGVADRFASLDVDESRRVDVDKLIEVVQLMKESPVDRRPEAVREFLEIEESALPRIFSHLKEWPPGEGPSDSPDSEGACLERCGEDLSDDNSDCQSFQPDAQSTCLSLALAEYFDCVGGCGEQGE